MKTRRSFHLVWTLFLSCSLAAPTKVSAEPQGAGQRAGEVSRVIPAVSIGRGGKTITAAAKSEVDWRDQIDTHANARARVLLDDGSVLNVGADSSMRVIKHDSAAQQTELELTYGKLRSQAQKLSRGDAKFEVRTPAGVAGVVGTDFYVEYSNEMMHVIVFEGFVRVCNLAGKCVLVKPGQMTSVRRGDNSPTTLVQAPLSMLTSATTDTWNGGNLGVAAPVAAHSALSAMFLIGALAAIPAVIVPVVVTRNQSTPPACQSQPGGPQPHCIK
jgi:ferric-dicitrate binding protein FerR (iron transport regulator)